MPEELQTISDASIQSRASDDGSQATGISVLSWLAIYNSLIAPWWSERRDRQLADFWRQDDSLSCAVYTLLTKLTSIPFTIQPRDKTIQAHNRQADEYQYNLEAMTDFGNGWVTGMSKFYQDLFTQDKGAFMEVIGDGAKDQPIRGSALGLAPIDAQYCILTGSPEYPVVYHDPDGGRYRLHYTRVMHFAQMPSNRADMNGVGYCAVSRCISAATHLYDIAVYKQEKLGSRPKRQMIVGRSGITAEQIKLAFKMSDEQMDNEGLSRFSKSVVIAPKLAQPGNEIVIDTIDIASIPDGFDERTSTELAWWVMAWAFGVDAREFIPATVSGATKADAMIQHMKARGKAVGNTLTQMTQLINRYYLPPYLEIVFDVQDDDEDQQRADIQSTRAATREKDLGDMVTTVRVERERMLQNGEITREQFIQLELEDGRLESGDEAIVLWQNPDYAPLLAIGVTDPLDATLHTWEELKPLVDARKVDNLVIIATAPQAKRKQQAREANAALDALKEFYDSQRPPPPTPPYQAAQEQVTIMQGGLPPMQEQDEQESEEEMGEMEDEEGQEEEGKSLLPFDKSVSSYYTKLNNLARSYFAGSISRFDFVDNAISIIRNNLIEAWWAAAKAMGLKPPNDLTDEEKLQIQNITIAEFQYLTKLADYIDQQKAQGNDYGKVNNRMRLWANRWNEVYNLGLAVFGKNQKLEWIYNPAKEHCEDCLKLNGRVYRATVWTRYGIHPQSRSLACGGYKCGCSFKPTKKPITPGKPPMMTGAL